ncbi:neprilysin-2-like isoform X2 [Ornithodoros turicata]|uniref:neprilysin-2-like isoform X2 n=1 Tax=Ornithodoros turicata TaxID=34597 RepID=UPI00313A111C
MSIWLAVILLTVPLPYEGKPTGDSEADRQVCTSEVCHRRGLLENEDLEGTIFRNVRAAYRSCTNDDIWQEEEVYAFQNVLKSAGISGWPLWPPTEQASDWEHLFASTRVGLNMGDMMKIDAVSHLFYFMVMRDLLFPRKYAAFLVFAEEELDGIEVPCYTRKEHSEKRCPEQMPPYHMLSGTTKDSVKAAIEILNGTISEQDAEAAAEDIIAFEVGLAELFLSLGKSESQKDSVQLVQDVELLNGTVGIETTDAIKSKITDFQGGLGKSGGGYREHTASMLTGYPGDVQHHEKLQQKLWQMLEKGSLTRVSIKDLQEALPQVQWSHFLNNIFSKANITIADDEHIFYVAVHKFERLLEYLASYERSTIQNFFGWRIVQHFENFVPQSLRRKRDNIQRWFKCTMDLSFQASVILGRLYVDHFFTFQSREQLRTVVEDVRSAIRKIVKGASWLDDSTRKKALEKVDKMVMKVGYLDWIKNDTRLQELYKDIGWVDPNTPYPMIRARYLNNKGVYHLKNIRRAYNRAERYISPMLLYNAAHVHLENSIEVTPAIASGLLFEEGLPPSVNFGSIGFVIGHEITHGFDATGRMYDAIGRHANWWSPEADVVYKKKAQCFIDMYDNITDRATGIKLNGQKTLSENIADNEGLHGAFKAYRQKLEDEGKVQDDALPGLDNVSGDQMFFISQAMAWCGNTNRVMLSEQVNTDVHSPDKYRVNPPLANMKEFADAFHCENNSPMVQKHKCALW